MMRYKRKLLKPNNVQYEYGKIRQKHKYIERYTQVSLDMKKIGNNTDNGKFGVFY